MKWGGPAMQILHAPKTPYKNAFEARVEALVVGSLTALDTDTGLFAARIYASRNSSFHEGPTTGLRSKKFADLADYVDMVTKRLEGLLAGEGAKLACNCRKIVDF